MVLAPEVQQTNLEDIQNFLEANRRTVIADILQPVGDIIETRALNRHVDSSIAVHIAGLLRTQLQTVQNCKGEDHLKESTTGIINRDTGVGVDHPGNLLKRRVQRLINTNSFGYVAAKILVVFYTS